MGHTVQTFSYTTSLRCICCWSGSLTASSLLTAWGKIFRSQITNTKTPSDPTFLPPHNSNKANTDSYTLSNFLWDVIMDFCRRVTNDENILYTLCTNTRSNVTDDRKNWNFGQCQWCAHYFKSHDVIPVFLLVTMIQVHTRKKAVNWIALMIKQVMFGTKLIKIQQQIFPLNHRCEYSYWDHEFHHWWWPYSSLRNSLIFTIVKTHSKGKHHLKHWSSPILHMKKEASHWD